MAFTLCNNLLLTTTFQATSPFAIAGEHIVLDWRIVVANLVTAPATPASVLWYPEFCSEDPNAAGTEWFRETAEEDIGNGDVRMPKTVRRWTENGDDLPLAEATHRLDAQFSRKHNYCRLQMAIAAGSADNTRASVKVVVGSAPQSPP
jgi:hypothetical protein